MTETHDNMRNADLIPQQEQPAGLISIKGSSTYKQHIAQLIQRMTESVIEIGVCMLTAWRTSETRAKLNLQ